MAIQFDDIHINPGELNKNSTIRGGCSGCNKLEVFDWLYDIKSTNKKAQLVEVRFKNTRKDFFENVNNLPLKKGDTVAVEASPGHDIGIVSLTGELVYNQLRKVNYLKPRDGFRKIYRLARPTDLDKWEEAKSLEHNTMIKARRITKDLNLDMKIGDVEYQGDRTKAIFYYIADERVDFRELIKVLAEEFRIRIEMRQIGARQEAARIGGIGSCGRELCCSKFMNKFVSVTTSAARYQELSLNPQKLAGQCGKLKCCLNYELDTYVEAQKDFPDTNVELLFNDGKGIHLKTDVFKKTMWYICNRESGNSIIALPVDRVKEIIAFNMAGELVEKLDVPQASSAVLVEPDYENVVGQESLTRFDEMSDKPKKKKRKNNKKNPRTNNQQKTQSSKEGQNSNKKENHGGGNSNSNSQKKNTKNRRRPPKTQQGKKQQNSNNKTQKPASNKGENK